MDDDAHFTTVATGESADADATLARAIGMELNLARRQKGWTRPRLIQELVEKLDYAMPVNTYACYEQGIRPCPLARLVDFCHVLEIGAPQLIQLALQRIGRDSEQAGVIIDLDKVISDTSNRLAPVRTWALNRRKIERLHQPDGLSVVHLEWAVIDELAILCDVAQPQLRSFIKRFTPDHAPRRPPGAPGRS